MLVWLWWRQLRAMADYVDLFATTLEESSRSSATHTVVKQLLLQPVLFVHAEESGAVA